MTDEMAFTIKEILDRIGVPASIEEIESGLGYDSVDLGDAFASNAIAELEAGHETARKTDPSGLSMVGRGQYFLIAGRAVLEYNGRAHKKYEGDVVLLVKPDDSLVIHGARGVVPVSYLARATEIRIKEEAGKLLIMAAAGEDRLTVTFVKMSDFRCLFQRPGLPGAAKPVDETAPLSVEERSLEAALKKLRIELAHSAGITFLPAVFDNRVLHALIRQRPKTIEDLNQIKGFGEKRIEKYGDSVLRVMNSVGPIQEQ